MIRIPIPDCMTTVALQDAEARVRATSVIHASTVEEAARDELGVVLVIGPIRLYASAEQAEALAHALASTASRIREAAKAQVYHA